MKRLLFATSALAAIAAPAWAGEVEVLTADPLPEVIVTATRLPAIAARTPGARVIDGRTIERRGAVFATDILADVPGLSFRLGDRVVRTAPRDRIADLNTIPSAVLLGIYDGFIPAGGGPGGLNLETNRGCPYGCTFCDWGSATLSRIRKFDLDRVFVRHQPHPQPHAAGGIIRLAAGEREGARMSVDGGASLRLPWPGQRIGRHVGIETGHDTVAAGLLIDEFDLPAFDLYAFQNHGAGGNFRPAATHPVQRAVLKQPYLGLGFLDAHVEDTRLAREERRKLGIHGKTGDLNERRSIRIRSGAHIMQCYRRERQDTGFDAAMHHHLFAENTACLILEIAAEIRPVDEIGNKQCRKQHHGQQSAQKNQNTSEH